MKNLPGKLDTPADLVAYLQSPRVSFERKMDWIHEIKTHHALARLLRRALLRLGPGEEGEDEAFRKECYRILRIRRRNS